MSAVGPANVTTSLSGPSNGLVVDRAQPDTTSLRNLKVTSAAVAALPSQPFLYYQDGYPWVRILFRIVLVSLRLLQKNRLNLMIVCCDVKLVQATVWA